MTSRRLPANAPHSPNQRTIKLFVLAALLLLSATAAATTFAQESSAPTREKPQTVEGLIRYHAETYGVDPEAMLAVARCESSLNPLALGDHGQSRGLYQIHRGYNPDVSDAEAYDPDFAAEWAARKFAEGKQRLWSCSRIVGIL